jgi:hypothetical protein
MENFNFKDNYSKTLYLQAIQQAIPSVAEESKSFIALLTCEIHKIVDSDLLIDEELNRYKALLQVIKLRQDLLDAERKTKERNIKLDLLIRKANPVASEDVANLLSKVASIILKYVPQTQQQQCISEFVSMLPKEN